MSGVVNEFDAVYFKLSKEEKLACLTMKDDSKFLFSYSIEAKYKSISSNTLFLFNFKNKECLIVLENPNSILTFRYNCCLMNFWMNADRPVLSSRWLYDQEKRISAIMPYFTDQYSTLLLDNIINS